MSNVRLGRRGSRVGAVSVSGPGYERDGLPTLGAGISAALSAATRNGDGTWYVRLDEASHYAVERRGGTTYVTPMKAAP